MVKIETLPYLKSGILASKFYCSVTKICKIPLKSVHLMVIKLYNRLKTVSIETYRQVLRLSGRSQVKCYRTGGRYHCLSSTCSTKRFRYTLSSYVRFILLS